MCSIDFSWELGENTSRQQLQATCVGCPPSKDITCRHCHFGITYYKKGSTELAEEYLWKVRK